MNARTHERTNKRRTNSRARERPPAARTHEQTTIERTSDEQTTHERTKERTNQRQSNKQINTRSDFERTGGPERAGAAVGSVSIPGGVPSVWLLSFRQYSFGLPSV